MAFPTPDDVKDIARDLVSELHYLRALQLARYTLTTNKPSLLLPPGSRAFQAARRFVETVIEDSTKNALTEAKTAIREAMGGGGPASSRDDGLAMASSLCETVGRKILDSVRIKEEEEATPRANFAKN